MVHINYLYLQNIFHISHYDIRSRTNLIGKIGGKQKIARTRFRKFKYKSTNFWTENLFPGAARPHPFLKIHFQGQVAL
jgi:hypothetical protein